MGALFNFLQTKDKQPGTTSADGNQIDGSVVIPTVDSSNAIGSLVNLLGPTPAEREAQERKIMQNRAKMQAWTGLFDGLRQLGNLYYATKGATPQTFNSPYQIVDQEIQQQRQFNDNMTNYRRQYNTSLYTLQRQMEADRRTNEEHKAKLDWYKNRDEQNAEKVDHHDAGVRKSVPVQQQADQRGRGQHQQGKQTVKENPLAAGLCRPDREADVPPPVRDHMDLGIREQLGEPVRQGRL